MRLLGGKLKSRMYIHVPIGGFGAISYPEPLNDGSGYEIAIGEEFQISQWEHDFISGTWICPH